MKDGVLTPRRQVEATIRRGCKTSARPANHNTPPRASYCSAIAAPMAREVWPLRFARSIATVTSCSSESVDC